MRSEAAAEAERRGVQQPTLQRVESSLQRFAVLVLKAELTRFRQARNLLLLPVGVLQRLPLNHLNLIVGNDDAEDARNLDVRIARAIVNGDRRAKSNDRH